MMAGIDIDVRWLDPVSYLVVPAKLLRATPDMHDIVPTMPAYFQICQCKLHSESDTAQANYFLRKHHGVGGEVYVCHACYTFLEYCFANDGFIFCRDCDRVFRRIRAFYPLERMPEVERR